MKPHQKQVGDIVELTKEGIEEIKNYPNNYSESNRPMTSDERTWSAWTLSNLWIGILISVLVYQVTSSFIALGMSWQLALFTAVLGHTLVMGIALLSGHFGTKYGLPYAMFSKAIFGPFGSIIPNLVRAIPGSFWFAIQAWIGGQALNAILKVIFPPWGNLGFWGTFISFLIFGAITVYIVAVGAKGIKILENGMAPVLIIISFLVIIWGLSTANWSFSELLSAEVLQPDQTKNTWTIFFISLSAMIAFDGAMVLSMSDFTKNVKTQKAQILGQMIATPIMTGFIAFVGIVGTAGAEFAFNKEIWEPAVLVDQFDNGFVVIFFSLVILASIITTNVGGNLVPPANIVTAMSASFFKKISYRNATIIAATIGLFAIPWKTAVDPTSLIVEFLGILGAVIGPLAGIMVVSYLVVHKKEIDLVDLFKEKEGKYYYNKGWELGAVTIFSILSAVIIISKFVPKIHFIFENAFVIGTILGGLFYFVYAKVSNFDQKYTNQLEKETKDETISN